jgi:dolichyl-phosphate-mannose-protein mannosyltransferase
MEQAGNAPQSTPPARTSRAVGVAVVLLLLVQASLALTSLRRSSVTIDEFSHLPAGLTYWQTRTFGLYHHNPPLVKMLAAAPVLLEHPVVDYGGSWDRARRAGSPPGHVEFAIEFMRSNADRYFELFNRGRAVIVLLSVVGGLLVFLWGRDLWGGGGGLLATALWCLDPNVLAHSGVVTTDLGASVAMVAATYVFWRWARAPSWRGAVLAGAVLGCAEVVKFSALLLYVVLPILALVRFLPGRAGRRGAPGPRPPVALVQGASILALSVLVINAVYCFEGTGRPLGGFPFLSPGLTVPRSGGEPPHHESPFHQALYRMRQNRFEGTWLGRLPTPLPEHYVLGFDEQRFESNTGIPGGGYAVYLRGEIRRATGWRSYYLWALAVKEPPGTWLLVIAALALALFIPALRLGAADEIAWSLPAAAVLAGMTLESGLDLGVRYVLPMLPFVFIGAGRLARLCMGRPRTVVLATCLLTFTLFWNAFETLVSWPGYLSYFNEFAGGPAGGHRYLIDSNLDWGQGLLDLRRWLDAHPQSEPVALAYFGAVDPAIAGIHSRLPPRDPRVVAPARRRPGETGMLRPGTYAVSVNYVQGLPHVAQLEDGTMLPVPQDAFGYFRLLRPVATAGDSIWIFRLDEGDVGLIHRAWEKGGGQAAE